MMKLRFFLLTDNQGNDHGGHGVTSKEAIPSQLPAPIAGQFYVELPGHPREWTVALVDGSVRPMRRGKSTEKQQAEAWQAAKAERALRERSGAKTPFGWVDTDPASILRIQQLAMGALIAKQAGKPFEVDLTRADNTTVHLDADGMLAVSQAVTQHMVACHETARVDRPLPL